MGYGYGGYGGYGGFGSGANVRVGLILAAIVFVAGFIASIVFTVKGYQRYVKKPGTSWSGIFSPQGIGPFLRFDTLLIERVLTVLYMFNAMMGVVIALTVWLAVLVSEFLAGLVALLPIAALLVLSELLMRLGYESTMLRVIVARNTTELKQGLGVDAHRPGPAASAPAPAPAPAPVVGGEGLRAPTPARARRHAQPAAGAHVASHAAQEQPVQPVQSVQTAQLPAQQPQSPQPAEPAPKADENSCPYCGATLRPGVRFCANCGKRLR